MKIKFVELAKKDALLFEYSFYPSPLGKILIIIWEKNVVYLAFADTPINALDEARILFPKAHFQKKENTIQKSVLGYLNNPSKSYNVSEKVFCVALKKTPFHLDILKALTKVPFGKKITYNDLAKKVGRPTAVRAAASAVAKNPVAILIPCHRVVPSTGGIGKYHWGTQKKSRLLTWENLNT